MRSPRQVLLDVLRDANTASADPADAQPMWPWIAAAVVILAFSGAALFFGTLKHSARPSHPVTETK